MTLAQFILLLARLLDLAHPAHYAHGMLHVHDSDLLAYRPAWDRQLELHEQVLSGQHPHGILMLVEHPSVITLGRRQGAQGHLLAPAGLLEQRGIEVVETDRGGDITFHGPGQLVAYPLLPLNLYGLNLHAYMRLLEQVVIETIGHFGITAQRDPSLNPATGVWVPRPNSSGHWPLTTDNFAKIAAIGIKVRRWVTLHGVALNVTTDLTCFDLINPCGLSRPVTSLRQLLGPSTPPMPAVKQTLTQTFQSHLTKLNGQNNLSQLSPQKQ